MVSEAGFEPAHPNKWAPAPQAGVSAVPPLRHVNESRKIRANNIKNYEVAIVPCG